MHCVCVKNVCLESQVVPFVMHATRKSEDGQLTTHRTSTILMCFLVLCNCTIIKPYVVGICGISTTVYNMFKDQTSN